MRVRHTRAWCVPTGYTNINISEFYMNTTPLASGPFALALTGHSASPLIFPFAFRRYSQS